MEMKYCILLLFFDRLSKNAKASSPDGLKFLVRHMIGITLDSQGFDLLNAGRPVRPENKAEYFRDEIVEFFAFVRIREILTLRAR